MGEQSYSKSQTYRNVSIPLDISTYQGNIHDSIAYGLQSRLEEPGDSFLNEVMGVRHVNRVLPEGYRPEKWPGTVEDWVITGREGNFCIGQSVSQYEKADIPFLDVRKDFHQARQFEQRIKIHPSIYDRLTGVFVVNLDEDYSDPEILRWQKEVEMYRDGETELEVVIHELEPSERDSFREAGEGLERIASD